MSSFGTLKFIIKISSVRQFFASLFFVFLSSYFLSNPTLAIEKGSNLSNSGKNSSQIIAPNQDQNSEITSSVISVTDSSRSPQVKKSKNYSEFSGDLIKIENYLNSIRNLSARFTQQSASGSVEGRFYLARNPSSAGKMRVEYLKKPKILIVVNGAILSYVDIELEETSRLSTNSTPASLLTRPNISFSAKDVEITNLAKTGDILKISLMKKNRKEAGEFSLFFKLNPIEFVKMEVKNDLEQIVSVSLRDLDLNSKISDNLFVVKSDE